MMPARPHEGRVALVTGAAQGIGRAIALDLAAGGARVALVDRTDAAETAELIRAGGGVAEALRCDIADPVAVRALESQVTASLGAADILVNNAGVLPVIAWDDLDFDAWRAVMSVNLDGTFLMCRTFGPAMAAAGWGRIVSIVSSAVGTGVTHFSHYIASKMGVIGLSRALASEYGPRGVTVNTVAPSLVATPATLGRATSPGGVSSAEEFAALIDVQAIKRTQQPEDIAGVVSFLATDAAAFVTAQTIYADGGVVRS